MIEDTKIIWYASDEWPDVVSDVNTGCSIDVLVHDPKADEHQIAWYNFNTFSWHFLRNENVNIRFKWRYFVNCYDRYTKTPPKPERVLKMTLKKKWFDMILAGIKKEEYREIKPYWILRLVKDLTKEGGFFIAVCEFGSDVIKEIGFEDYTHITFRNGYATKAPEFTIELKSMEVRTGKEEWGAIPGKKYFVMNLGKITNKKNIKIN